VRKIDTRQPISQAARYCGKMVIATQVGVQSPELIVIDATNVTNKIRLRTMDHMFDSSFASISGQCDSVYFGGDTSDGKEQVFSYAFSDGSLKQETSSVSGAWSAVKTVQGNRYSIGSNNILNMNVNNGFENNVIYTPNQGRFIYSLDQADDGKIVSFVEVNGSNANNDEAVVFNLSAYSFNRIPLSATNHRDVAISQDGGIISYSETYGMTSRLVLVDVATRRTFYIAPPVGYSGLQDATFANNRIYATALKDPEQNDGWQDWDVVSFRFDGGDVQKIVATNANERLYAVG
jgi:hypothetical protein